MEVPVSEPQSGLDRYIDRLKEQQRQTRRKQRIGALSAHMANMRHGWLLVYVKDGSPVSVREAKLLPEGQIIQL